MHVKFQHNQIELILQIAIIKLGQELVITISLFFFFFLVIDRRHLAHYIHSANTLVH